MRGNKKQKLLSRILLHLLLIMFVLVPILNVSVPQTVQAAETAAFTNSNRNKISYKNSTYTYLGMGTGVNKDGSLNKAGEAETHEDLIYGAVFKYDQWKNPCDGLLLCMGNLSVEDSKARFITIPYSEYDKIKNHIEYKGTVEATHFTWNNKWYWATWDFHPVGLTVQMENSNQANFSLTWFYEKFSPAAMIIKLTSKSGGTDTLALRSNQVLLAEFEGSTYIVKSKGFTTEIDLPKVGDVYDKNGKVLESGVQITNNNPDAPNFTPGVGNIVGKIYIGGDKDEKFRVKDEYGKKIDVKIESLTKGVTAPVSKASYDTTSGKFSFSNIPVKAKYKLTVNQKLDSSWADFGQWVNGLGDEPFLTETMKAFAGIATDDYVLKGETEVTLDANGASNPADPHIIVAATTVTAEEKTGDLIKEALEGAIDTIVNWALKAIEMMMGWVNGILNRANYMGDDPALKAIWMSIRNVTLSVLTLGILLIAFANVLQIDIEKYNVTRLIPKLVIATVMSYFSYLMATFLLSLVAAFQIKLIGETGTNTVMANLNQFGTSGYETLKSGMEFGTYVLALILVLILVLVACIVLCILMIVRIAILWLLIAISPLAFMMQVMPFTEHFYLDWWNKFFKWAFMGPAVLFLLFLSAKVIDASAAGLASGESSPIFQLFMAGILVFMSTIIPFTMGGEVFKGIGIDQQSLWRQAPGFKEGQSLIAQRKKPGEERANRRATRARAWMAGRSSRLGGIAGRFGAGVTKEEALGLQGEKDSAYKKVFENAKKEDLNKYIEQTDGKGAYGEAALKAAAEGGKLDMKNQKIAEIISREIGKDNKGLIKAIEKEAPDAFAEAVNKHGSYPPGTPMFDQAIKSLNKRKVEDLKGEEIKFISNNGVAGGATAGIVAEIAHSKEQLDKIAGLGRDTQAKWGQILSTHAHATAGSPHAAEIARLTTAFTDHVARTGANPI